MTHMKRNKKIRWFILVIFLFSVFLVDQSTTFAAEQKETIVRVACGMNEVLYLNDEGEPEGIGLPYLRQLAWNENWTLEYIEGSYNESLERLYSGEIDLMLPVGEDEDPDGKLAYSKKSIGYQHIGLFAKNDADIFYDDYKGFDKKRVGLSVGSNSNILDEYAKKNGFSYEKVPLNSKQDKINALNDGTVDMIAFSTLNTVPDGKLVANLDVVPVYVCTNAKNQTIIDGIDHGMSEIMAQTPEIATELYQQILTGKNPISYTREENEKIQSAKTIVFGVYGDRLPLAGIDKAGNCVGIYVDLLKEIAKQSGLTIKAVPIKESNQLYHYIDDGTVDFVIGIQELRFSQENAENHLSSNHITDCATIAVTKQDYKLDQVDAPVIALTRDRTYLETTIQEWFPKASIQYFDNRRDCLDAVNKEKCDATFLNIWEYNYEIKNARYKDLIQWENYKLLSGITLGGSRASDLELLSILEKTIGKVSATRISDIVTENLNKEYQTYTISDYLYEWKTVIISVSIFCLILLVCLYVYVREKKKYIKTLVEANRTKTEFLSRMSHELRTPLNAISGYTTFVEENLNDEDVDEESVNESFEAIHRAVTYQLSIIGDLLDIQQIEAGKLKLHKTEVLSSGYLENIVNMVKPEAEEKKLEFIFQNESKVEDVYCIDGIRFQQVLLNLLHNAIKFTNEGGKVTFTAKRIEKGDTHDRFRFIVSDTGIGMSQEFLKNDLFKRFAQEYAGNTSPYEGCGTGLEISKEIVNMMDGTIECTSEKDVGSTFTVTLPVEVVKRRKRRKRKQYATIDMSGMKILLCEDNKMNQDMECRLLCKMNCKVDVADDGVVGLEKYLSNEDRYYDLILMDIRMPNMDGWECTRQIRASQKADAKTIPIIAISANAFDEDVHNSIEAGMNEHVAKPIDARILYEKLVQYCSGEQ